MRGKNDERKTRIGEGKHEEEKKTKNMEKQARNNRFLNLVGHQVTHIEVCNTCCSFCTYGRKIMISMIFKTILLRELVSLAEDLI